jgi:hypothetical protein
MGSSCYRKTESGVESLNALNIFLRTKVHLSMTVDSTQSAGINCSLRLKIALYAKIFSS